MSIKNYIFAFLVLFSSLVYTDPPPLPILETTNSNNIKSEAVDNSTESFFKKIGGWFGKDKKPKQNDRDIKSQASSLEDLKPNVVNNPSNEIDDDKPFLDLGDNKLPSLDNTNSEATKDVTPQDKISLPKIDEIELPSLDESNSKSLQQQVGDSTNKPNIQEPSENTISTLPEENKNVPIQNTQKINETNNEEQSPGVIEQKIEQPSETIIQQDNAKSQNSLDQKQLDSNNPKTIINVPDSTINTTTTPTINSSTSEVPATYPQLSEDEKNKGQNIEDINSGVIPTNALERGKLEQIENNANTQIQVDNLDESDPLANPEEFVNNETKMLLLPNDEVILGQIALETKLEEMDFFSYLEFFNKNYRSKKDQKYQASVSDFINTYYNNTKDDKALNQNQAITESFDSIRNNNLVGLKAMVTNYPILQKSNYKDNSLLQAAIEDNNYFIAKYLLLKGANLSLIDYPNKGINNNILLLLEKAK